jgi:hypothetical protein
LLERLNPYKDNKKAEYNPYRRSFSHKNPPILLQGLPISRKITVIWPFYGILAQKSVNSFARIYHFISRKDRYHRLPAQARLASPLASLANLVLRRWLSYLPAPVTV